MARINNTYLSPYEATIARYFPSLDKRLYPAEAELYQMCKDHQKKGTLVSEILMLHPPKRIPEIIL